MTESLQETLALGVAITVLAVVVLRLVAASYFVWKEDQEEKRCLSKALSSPEREASAAMLMHTVELRKELSDRLGLLSAYACYPATALSKVDGAKDGFGDLLAQVDALINQLSYDFPLRIAAIKLRDYCLELIRDQRAPEDHFWTQRKITFRLLHKQDTVADFMSLMELEVLLEDAGLSSSSKLDTVEKLKAVIRELGPKYYEKETQDLIKKSLSKLD